MFERISKTRVCATIPAQVSQRAVAPVLAGRGKVSLVVGNPVVCADGVPLGRVVEVEVDAAGTVTGLIVQRTGSPWGEVRLPIGWVSDASGDVVSLGVLSKEVSLPRTIFLVHKEPAETRARELATRRRIHPNWLRPRAAPPQTSDEN